MTACLWDWGDCKKARDDRESLLAEVERLKALLVEVRENIRTTPHMGGEVSNPSIRDRKAMCEWVLKVAALSDPLPEPKHNHGSSGGRCPACEEKS